MAPKMHEAGLGTEMRAPMSMLEPGCLDTMQMQKLENFVVAEDVCLNCWGCVLLVEVSKLIQAHAAQRGSGREHQKWMRQGEKMRK